MEALSQRDPRWKDIPLGTSQTTTIGSHGCTITAIAMLAGLTPDEVNRRLLQVQGYASTNLVIWSKIKEAIPWLDHEKRVYSYNNEDVKLAIEKYGGCLIEVDFDGKISTPRDQHWVVYKGDQKMIDPWTGSEKPTSYYPIVEGYSVIKVSQKPETPINSDTKFDFLNGVEFSGNLVNTLKYLFVENKVSEGDIRGAIEDFKKGTVKHLEGVIANKSQELEKAEARVKTLAEQNDVLAEEAKQNLEKYQQIKENYEQGKAQAKAAGYKEGKEVYRPYRYYTLSKEKLASLAIRKWLGADITPEEIKDEEVSNNGQS